LAELNTKTMLRALKVLVMVLVVLLVVLVALLVRGRKPLAMATGGGAGARRSFSDALLRVRKEQTRQDARPPPRHALESRPRSVAQVRRYGGAAKKKGRRPKPRKPWTKYKTWEKLDADEGARAAYWRDVDEVLGALDLDWSDVRTELAEKIRDDREWAGRINLVKGKPKIVELVPSPHAVGEGPLPRQAAAMVPGELIARLEAKPGLFMFHTHPGEVGGSTMPSPIDIAGAMHIAYTGRYAADLVVSPYGVFMYTPNAAFRRAVWADNTPAEARLALYRKISDLLAGLGGSRSWESPWTLDNFVAMIRRYDVEYVIFPTDKYAWADRRQAYTSPPEVDHEHLHDYQARVKELEEVAAGQTVVGQ
jgi:hypothetical protein